MKQFTINKALEVKNFCNLFASVVNIKLGKNRKTICFSCNILQNTTCHIDRYSIASKDLSSQKIFHEMPILTPFRRASNGT